MTANFRILIIILQTIVALGIVTLVHELGHLIWAKVFGVRVDKLFVFFDLKGFSLLRWKPANSQTEFGIGWIPLGGYCKMSGMGIDNDSPTSDNDYRAKSFPQKIAILAGGIANNLILSAILYSLLFITSESSPHLMQNPHFCYCMGLVEIVTTLSLIMAAVNALPIPILDGGSIMLLCIERIRRRPLTEDTKAYANFAGAVILLLLFLCEIIHEIFKYTS